MCLGRSSSGRRPAKSWCSGQVDQITASGGKDDSDERAYEDPPTFLAEMLERLRTNELNFELFIKRRQIL